MSRPFLSATLLLAGSLFFSSCAIEASNSTAQEAASKAPDGETSWKVKAIHHGKASWYGIRCNGGTHTASGETLRNHAPTAAHKTLPMGTKVRVTNLNNGKSEVVKINDRGPYIKGRIIDVTEGVAKRLDFFKRGIVRVKVEVLEKGSQEESS